MQFLFRVRRKHECLRGNRWHFWSAPYRRVDAAGVAVRFFCIQRIGRGYAIGPFARTFMHRLSGPTGRMRHRSARSRSRPLLQGAGRRTVGAVSTAKGGGIGVKDRGQDRSHRDRAGPVGAVSTAKGGGIGVEDRGQDRSYKRQGAASTRTGLNLWERSRPRRGRHRSKRSRSRPLLQR